MSKEVKLMQGNIAVAEGAIAAGMTFYGGYPISPSSEVAERSSELLPLHGGSFLQMEDEIAGISATIGAASAGAKAMTATSGPGLSLKAEGIGYAIVAQVPIVIVDVQRMGPSTGLPTQASQGDIMQAKWGTHGDHPVIALCPNSVKEAYDLTIKAFNLAEEYKTPVFLMLDEIIGHMREKIEIPSKDEITIVNRKVDSFGEGKRVHKTGLFYNEKGYPDMSPENADRFLNMLLDKVNNNVDKLTDIEEFMIDDADIAIVSFGSTSRAAKQAVLDLREEGIRVGLFRLKTIWPSPEKELLELSKKVKSIVVAEMNMGQYVTEVERIIKNNCKLGFVGDSMGEPIKPEKISNKVKEVL